MKSLYHSRIGFAENHGATDPLAKKPKEIRLRGESGGKIKSFEEKLPPWRRWRKKSNGRLLLGNSRVIKAIRGIHIRTRGMK